MRKLMIMSGFAAAAVIGSTPAMAQGSPTPAPPNAMTRPVGAEHKNFEQLYDMETLFRNSAGASLAYENAIGEARCVISVDAKRAAAMIGGEGTADPTYAKMSRDMPSRYRNCIRDGRGRIVPVAVSGAITELLVKRENPGPYDDRAKNVNVDEAAKFHGDLEGQITVGRIARCLTVYSPGLAYKVLASDIGSDGETAALDTLYTQTPECGVTARPADIPNAFQRAAIAQALYAWNHQTK